jgi:hypothetical protein
MELPAGASGLSRQPETVRFIAAASSMHVQTEEGIPAGRMRSAPDLQLALQSGWTARL